jgi:hypothetical protein
MGEPPMPRKIWNRLFNGLRSNRLWRLGRRNYDYFEMKLWALSFVPFFLLMAGGCNALPRGEIKASQLDASGRGAGAVYLLRGWRGLWSSGMDDLAGELRESGVSAAVYADVQWKPLAGQIVEDARSGRVHSPLVLIGFSYGADDVIDIARVLEGRGIPVDLLITIDPVTPSRVPRNVRECVNFYQSNGFWDVFPWLRGTPLESDSPDERLINQNLRTDRTDLLEPGTSHATIAANRKLHRAIVERVVRTVGRGGDEKPK